MEGHANKRRRVYSMEPREIMQASFSRKYVNFLVPALSMNRKLQTSSSDQRVGHEIEKIVRYEVDMALASSAEGFAWSHALKHNLQRNVNNVGRFQGCLTHDQLSVYGPNYHANMAENVVDDSQNAMLLMKKISPNAISNQKPVSTSTKSKREKSKEMEPGNGKEEGMGKEEEESRRRLTYLRSLLPGGSEMMDDDAILLSELGSYISCLELQVNILRSLVGMST